ncbi:MAG: glycosyltransferase [Symploca sp. SIO2C1]|nr:glycosyltransferase [Symploca sp. SIO2C1]
MNASVLGITVLSLVIWLGLLGFRGQFWRANQRLDIQATELELWPKVCAVIPARNEAELLPITLRSLFTQDYPGSFSVLLVDDHSTDGTAEVAQKVAQESKQPQQLQVISAQPLPAGWTGKLWALEQGIRHAQEQTGERKKAWGNESADTDTRRRGDAENENPTSYFVHPEQTQPPDYFLLTDADIEHDSTNLRELITKAETQQLDLVSLMVLLRCQSFWEQLLIPAFVFFFQKLYPFPLVNDSTNSTAAAAGGCILIRRQALNRIGGLQVVRQALIDDCALATAVKSSIQSQLSPPGERKKGWGNEQTDAETRRHGDAENGNSTQNFAHPSPPTAIWLGLTESTRSLRPYPSLASIWDMVARTAFYQLNYSPLLLIGTVLGMTLIYLVPPIAAIFGALIGNWLIAIAGFASWLLMAGAYLPTLRLYKCSPLLAFCLPAIAFLYNLMTLDSALRHWQGRGGSWKGRVYD